MGGGDQTAPRGCSAGALILGMHRSGTSAVAGALARAGFDAGPDADLVAGNAANPEGYFERNSLMRLNDRLLAAAGGTWFDPPDPAQVAALGPAAREGAQRYLTGLLSDDRPLVIKDPRIGLLLPVWVAALEQLSQVLVLRHPAEVAGSLQRRDRLPPSVGLCLWECHLRQTLAAVGTRPVWVVPFQRVLDRPEELVVLAEGLTEELTPDRATRVRPELAAEGVNRMLGRRGADADLLEQLSPLPQRRLWDWLAALPAGRQRLEVPPELAADRPAARQVVHLDSERTGGNGPWWMQRLPPARRRLALAFLVGATAAPAWRAVVAGRGRVSGGR